jgi:cytochrome P450
MTATLEAGLRPLIPEDIAKIVIAPKSYTNDDVIYPAFKWLRENMPLGVAEVDGYDPIWIVTKHADIRAIELNAKLFHNADHNPILNDRASDAFMRQINGGSTRLISSLTYMDPPEHAAYRNLTQNWFMPGRISRLEDQIRVLARQSVDKLLSFDGECDFVRDFALHYPLRVIMTLFGVPPEDEPRMLKLTQEFFGVHDPEEQRPEIAADPVAAAKMWAATLEDFYTYFDDLSAQRRAHPTDDMLSLIANSQVNGAPIPRNEANGYYVAIATAGHDTTSSSTAGGLHGMLLYPENFARLKDDPSLVKGLVDEAIRWTSPVKHFMRNAVEDTQVRGQAIRAMDRLMMCYPSGNRDEEVFADPTRFDITRSPNPHIAFGFGPHMCLGQHLAKLEMRVLFEELLPHLDKIELAADPRMVETNFVGGYKTLPIRFTKR